MDCRDLGNVVWMFVYVGGGFFVDDFVEFGFVEECLIGVECVEVVVVLEFDLVICVG